MHKVSENKEPACVCSEITVERITVWGAIDGFRYLHHLSLSYDR